MKALRFAGAALALITAVLVISIQHAPSASADPAWWRYISLNVHGSDTNEPSGNHGGLNSVVELTNYVQYTIDHGTAPVSVAVQELCYDNGPVPTYSQYNWLYDFFTARGYAAEFGVARNLTANKCFSFGNAIFSWGSSRYTTPGQQNFKMVAGPPDHPGAHETRAMVCLGEWMFATVIYHSCSTHLDNLIGPSEVPYVFAKLRYDWQIPSQYITAALGGDFNTRCPEMDDNPADPFYDYREADPGCTMPTDGANKIDFQWGRRNNLTNPQTPLLGTKTMVYSDHKLLESAFLHP